MGPGAALMPKNQENGPNAEESQRMLPTRLMIQQRKYLGECPRWEDRRDAKHEADCKGHEADWKDKE